MNSKGRFSDAIFGASLRPRTAVLVMAIIVVLFAIPAFAQNTLPTTVREAAASGASAPRSIHPAMRPPQGSRPFIPRHGTYAPAQNDLYDNGPTNGTSDAYWIDVYVVSDSFVPNVTANMASFDIALWTPAGATPLTADWAIGTSSFGSDVASGSGAWTSLTLLCSNGQNFNGGMCGGGFGYDVYDANFTVPNNPAVTGGNTYWVTLTGVTDSFGGRDAWDINSGPALAYHNLLGQVPSESFSINGAPPPPPPPPPPPGCFESGWPIQIIHDFTLQENPVQSWPTGVTIDRAGVLYGTTPRGGNSGAGLLFRLSDTTPGWNFNRLYNFTGNASGAGPSAVILGPDGSLYGTAAGGIQNCGSDQSQWCGLVFAAKPFPAACLGNACTTEKTIYAFSGNSDGTQPGVFAFDPEGNLYGTTYSGGGGSCNGGCGTVFKLTPTPTSWAKTTLYSFTGSSDGYFPSQVLVGNDGNLYGLANSSGSEGELFQLTPSGGGWVLNVLHTFQYPDGSPSYLMQDSSENLYGIGTELYSPAKIFMLSKSGGSWVFSEFSYQHQPFDFDMFLNLTIDASGTLYGTGQTGISCAAGLCPRGKNPQGPMFMNYVFQAWYADGAWNYNDIAEFPLTAFDSSGELTLDGRGNLYGTTWDCGKYGAGTIWKLVY